ncbi:MAG: radical SAM protein [Elusimicrobia bacterium]|nr:radical SAM protein [Elusimicrobiota bacterium]
MALHLPINAECNIQCVFCSAAGRGGDFSLPKLLAEIDADKTGHVQISGGDPLLKDPAELLAILAHCKKKRKVVEFQTNAVLVTQYDPARLRLLAKLVDFFNVNFSAHTAQLDFEVTGAPGGFEKRIEGIRLLAAIGSTVRLTYIMHKANVAYCREFVDFAAATLPMARWIQFSYVKGMGRAKGNDSVVPRFAEAAAPLNAAMDRCRELGLRYDVDHIPACFVRGHLDHHVDYQKMLRDLPGVHLSEKQNIAECEGCALRAHCPGPRLDYVELYGGLHS